MLQPQIIRLTRLVLTHQSHFFLSIFNSHKNKKDTTKTHRRPLPSDIRHKDTLSNKVVQKTDQRAHSTPKFYKEGNTDKTSARV